MSPNMALVEGVKRPPFRAQLYICINLSVNLFLVLLQQTEECVDSIVLMSLGHPATFR